MAAYFQLLQNDTPIPFQQIDDQLRAVFGEKPDSKNWLYNWYNFLGLPLALGDSWAKIRETYADDAQLQRVIDWLEANYEVKAWASR